MITQLATLSLNDLNHSIDKHPYYVKLAIDRKKELERNKEFVPPEKIINALKNIKKKTNSRYIEKVNYNKRNGIKPWEN